MGEQAASPGILLERHNLQRQTPHAEPQIHAAPFESRLVLYFWHWSLHVVDFLSEPKMDAKDPNLVINEVCEIRNCNKCIFLENRKKKDSYLWMSNVPRGPSVKFLVENGKCTKLYKRENDSSYCLFSPHHGRAAIDGKLSERLSSTPFFWSFLRQAASPFSSQGTLHSGIFSWGFL